MLLRACRSRYRKDISTARLLYSLVETITDQDVPEEFLAAMMNIFCASCFGFFSCVLCVNC